MNTQSNIKENDQADELRNLFHELEENNEEEKSAHRNEKQMDVLNLPPRKEVHGKNKRMKLKVSKPFLRFVVILIIVVLCLVAVLYLGEGDFPSILHRL